MKHNKVWEPFSSPFASAFTNELVIEMQADSWIQALRFSHLVLITLKWLLRNNAYCPPDSPVWKHILFWSLRFKRHLKLFQGLSIWSAPENLHTHPHTDKAALLTWRLSGKRITQCLLRWSLIGLNAGKLRCVNIHTVGTSFCTLKDFQVLMSGYNLHLLTMNQRQHLTRRQGTH